MKYKIKETKLADGDKVFDLDLFTNSRSDLKPMCIFSCPTKKDAEAFYNGLFDLIEKHTFETLKVAE